MNPDTGDFLVENLHQNLKIVVRKIVVRKQVGVDFWVQGAVDKERRKLGERQLSVSVGIEVS